MKYADSAVQGFKNVRVVKDLKDFKVLKDIFSVRDYLACSLPTSTYDSAPRR